MARTDATIELRRAALRWLAIDAPDALAHAVREGIAAGGRIDAEAVLEPGAPVPARPARPRLVAPERVPRRSPFTTAGRAALLHAIAHIEMNAVRLALDAAWRFPGLPEAYYRDWLGVADDEARHFGLLRDHLRSLGHDYGDFDAHDGLWTMCERTAHDPLARMALVPRLLEARGLDATPPMQARLAKAGDARAVEILDVILRDEIGHVAVGNRWYRHLCAMRGLDPVATFRTLARAHGAPRLKPPFNLRARAAAGFDAAELDALRAGAN